MIRLGNGNATAIARVAAVGCGLLLAGRAVRAQEVRIENVTVTAHDAKTATIRFDIAWDNSWRHEVNHDAIWVFFKVRADDKSQWQHVRLAADKVLNPTGYGHDKDGTPLDLIVPDGKDGYTGMFVRRARYGAMGPMATRNVTAVWDLTANKGIAKAASASVRAFGIRMVYVAEGPFYLGSGGWELNGFYMYTDGTQQTLPYRVTGPGAIPTGRQAGKLWARTSEPLGATAAPLVDGGEIPASFPNGYAAFYCMIYPITDFEYAGFLNTLTAAEATARYPYGERHSDAIVCSGAPPNVTYVGKVKETRGGGYGGQGLSWADGVAFAAWAGLRPMTELECEKAIRGPREPVPDESGPAYWGAIRPSALGAWHAGKGGQIERAVTAGNPTGREFKGTHGEGTTALPADWPQDDAVGAGFRCGPGQDVRPDARSDQHQRHRLSDRLEAALAAPEREHGYRWRGVRTAPAGVGP